MPNLKESVPEIRVPETRQIFVFFFSPNNIYMRMQIMFLCTTQVALSLCLHTIYGKIEENMTDGHKNFFQLLVLYFLSDTSLTIIYQYSLIEQSLILSWLLDQSYIFT